MIYPYLPDFIFKRLFGDRRKYGTTAIVDDPEFLSWQKSYQQFYLATQKDSIGSVVNHWGFKIVKELNYTNKIVLELGPGIIEHFNYNQTRPERFIIADVRQDFLDLSKEKLIGYGIQNVESILISKQNIPLPDQSVDIVISFHQLEHINQLADYLDEIKRVLRPRGVFVGAAPCEGALAYGMGRFLISRRQAIKKFKINYDKVICWEHPNFVDRIKRLLDERFEKIVSVKKPFSWLPFEFNISWSFIYQKRNSQD